MKKIPLSQGKYAIVDDCDFDIVSKYKWYFNSGYACRGVFNGTNMSKVLMHRFILNVKQGNVCDHVNMDKLDNRRNNIRICSYSQNRQNTGITARTQNGYKGIYQRNNKWRAKVTVNGKQFWSKTFPKKIDAIKKYNEMAIIHHGEFAQLNIC